MTRAVAKNPTELELEVLKILWEKHPATVREVRDALVPKRKLAYTTVMTVMSILAEKGFLKRVKEGNGYLYSPAVKREHTMKRVVRDLAKRWFDGSNAAALAQLLDEAELNKNDLSELKRLLDRKIGEKP
jgi:BlaI family penicillinase repressor